MSKPEEIFAKTARLLAGKRIIGISGPDASGKTTFAKGYAEFLRGRGAKVQALSIDDFHNPLAIRRSGPDEVSAYYGSAFDYAKLIREVLDPLKRDGKLHKTVTHLDVAADAYCRQIEYNIDEDSLLLIEGVLLFRPPLLEYFDAMVFLRVSLDEVKRRAFLRDVPVFGPAFMDKYDSRYVPAYLRYLAEYSPETACDILIDNDDFTNPKICER